MTTASPLPLSAALAGLFALAIAGCGERDPGETHVALIEGGPGVGEVVVGASAQGLVRFDARGQIQPAIAERWHVSDDGLSYIFRIGGARWSDGGEITAEEIANLLRARLEDEPLADALGAIDEVVAMTDRVLEIRLVAPRPHLLTLLAQPSLGLVREDAGSGPFRIDVAPETEEESETTTVHLVRDLASPGDDETRRERVHVELHDPGDAIAAFVSGEAELVLGGSFATLPLVREAAIGRGSLRYDPVAGLFGLMPVRDEDDAEAFDTEMRRAMSRAIDRTALIEELGVPALLPRATILQDGLDLAVPPPQPDWLGAEGPGSPLDLFGRGERDDEPAGEGGGGPSDKASRRVAIALPEGPGSDLLLARLAEDWAPLGLAPVRAEADDADFMLVDRVAPSESAAWFLRQFSCARARVCDPTIDTLLAMARAAPTVNQRHAILADAGARMDDAALFLPIAAPIRWSLVSPGVTGFTENRFAFHPLTGLKGPLPVGTAR